VGGEIVLRESLTRLSGGGLAHGSQRVAVLAAPGDDVTAKLAAELGLPLLDSGAPGAFDYLLVNREGRVALVDTRERSGVGIWVDFSDAAVPRGLTRRQPLGRALGKKVHSVVDATAGLGQDALMMAHLGYAVTAVERSPVLAALLDDGLRRAGAAAVAARRLRIVHGDGRRVLDAMDPKPDAVYLDPMFPPKRRKSALARKEVRAIRALVGDDPDAESLFLAAMRNARLRVVVKRPSYAPPLAPDPAVSYPGKLVRYDVYHVAPADAERG
jgi:16S rRNA (guanine1516-N2)-methyltransferase